MISLPMSARNHQEFFSRSDCVPVIRNLLPSLILIGLDIVSITNPGFREFGRDAHRKLLCSDSPILILEDLDLSSESLAWRVFRLTIIPYTTESDDGVPVFCLAD